jgi:hypothetical protein
VPKILLLQDANSKMDYNTWHDPEIGSKGYESICLTSSLLGELSWCLPPQTRVRPIRCTPFAISQNLGLPDAEEQYRVQQLIAKPSIERFHMSGSRS